MATSTSTLNRILGLLLLITLVQLILKLSGHLHYSWWLVWAPLWLPWAMLFVLLTLLLGWRLIRPVKVSQP